MPELPELVEWQLLAGLQLLIEPYALMTPPDRLGMAWAHVARAGVALGAGDDAAAGHLRVAAGGRGRGDCGQAVDDDAGGGAAEGCVGSRGVRDPRAPQMDFTHIHQRWLREAAKGYTIERMASADAAAQRDVRLLGHLSDYLHAREDRGEQPGALTREDMTGFLSWLQSRVPADNRRHIVVSSTRRDVQFARRHLAGSGQPRRGSAAGSSSTTRTCRGARCAIPTSPAGRFPASCWRSCSTRRCSRRSTRLPRVSGRVRADRAHRPTPGEICDLAAECLRYEEEPAPDGGKQRRPVLRYGARSRLASGRACRSTRTPPS